MVYLKVIGMYLMVGFLTMIISYTAIYSIKYVFVGIGKIIRGIVRDELSKFNIR